MLADVSIKDYGKIEQAYADTMWSPHLNRLAYLINAQMSFETMIDAWRRGDVEEVGALFRNDGRGLRDDYCISGPELETMCDIARTVDGVYGERMLGGGDKGAAGAIVRADAVGALKAAVARAYPLAPPALRVRRARGPRPRPASRRSRGLTMGGQQRNGYYKNRAVPLVDSAVPAGPTVSVCESVRGVGVRGRRRDCRWSKPSQEGNNN